MINTTNKKRIGIFFCLLFLSFLIVGNVKLQAADTRFGLTEMNISGTGDNKLPAGVTDIKKLIGGIITYLLGFLGVIFLILIIYAGYIWMMARGDEKEVEKAQGLIKTSIIGLIIILCSYIIADFVLGASGVRKLIAGE